MIDGSWQLADVEAVSATVWRRIAEATDELRSLAEDYAEALTELTQARVNVRVLDLGRGQEHDKEPGFLLLLGKHQLSVRLKQQALVAELSVVRDFQQMAQGCATFTARSDNFGSLLWQTDNALLMSSDLIIKRLFEHLIKASRQLATGED